MVFASHGRVMSEAEIRTMCDCTPLGTEALKAVDAARALGFPGTGKHTLTINDLATQLDHGTYPIVFVNLVPIDGIRSAHTLVVVSIDQTTVSVYDPLHRERHLPRATFESAWAMLHNLAILVHE
jgi:predicted double-glycine peptidase